MPLTRVILLFTLLATVSPRESSAQAVDPLRLPEPEARRWANRLFNPTPTSDATAAWRQFERGSFDEFGATGAEYVRAFPSHDRSVAAVVTYLRDRDSRRGLAITARVALVTSDGAKTAEFDVVPHLQFDVSNDGRIVVGHGETMVGAHTCGILNNSLSLYTTGGAAPRHLRSPEFSPAHSLVVLGSPGRIVMAVAGRILAFDPDSGLETWRRTLDHRNDMATLVPHPDGDALAATIQTHTGDARVELIDGAGAELGRYLLTGRPAPGAPVSFDDSGIVALRDIVADEMRLHLLDGRSLAHLRTLLGK